MRNMLRLSFAYLRHYKKQTAALFVGILLSAALLTGVGSLFTSGKEAAKENARTEYGDWHYETRCDLPWFEAFQVDVEKNGTGDGSLNGDGFRVEKYGIEIVKKAVAEPFDIQIMTPMRKGALGVERLNTILQNFLNPPSPDKAERAAGQTVYRVGDKVMQIKNNYQIEWEIRNRYGIPVDKGLGVFNGDVGVIREINLFAELLTVEFDEGKMVEYSFKQLEELELAYAITIHKSQGSEYPAVIIPLLGGPRMLMNRNLLYTAVTRARRCVTLVGDEKTFYEMEENRMEQSRYTALDLWIKECH